MIPLPLKANIKRAGASSAWVSGRMEMGTEGSQVLHNTAYTHQQIPGHFTPNTAEKDSPDIV